MKKYKLILTCERIFDKNEAEQNNNELIQNNLLCFSPRRSVRTKIDLSKGQKKVLYGIENHKRVIIRKDRQTGVSTILNGIVACELVKTKQIPIHIIYYSINQSLSYVNALKIRENIYTLINALNLDIKFEINNKNNIQLSNGNSIEYLSQNQSMYYTYRTNKDKIVWFIFDEFAFAERGMVIYKEVTQRYPNSKITIVSTQNGLDELFFPIYLLGSKAGYFKVDVPYVDAHEDLMSKVVEFKKNYNDLYFIESFSDTFLVENTDKLNSDIITELIKPHLLPDETFTFYDMIEFIQANKIINKKNIWG